jgi:hypothetical protein
MILLHPSGISNGQQLITFDQITVRVIGQKQQEVVRSPTNRKLLWSRSRLARLRRHARDRAVASLGQECLRFDTKGTPRKW